MRSYAVQVYFGHFPLTYWGLELPQSAYVAQLRNFY